MDVRAVSSLKLKSTTHRTATFARTDLFFFIFLLPSRAQPQRPCVLLLLLLSRLLFSFLLCLLSWPSVVRTVPCLNVFDLPRQNEQFLCERSLFIVVCCVHLRPFLLAKFAKTGA
jgi:hypothetical protein